jgi:hypothetical protein
MFERFRGSTPRLVGDAPLVQVHAMLNHVDFCDQASLSLLMFEGTNIAEAYSALCLLLYFVAYAACDFFEMFLCPVRMFLSVDLLLRGYAFSKGFVWSYWKSSSPTFEMVLKSSRSASSCWLSRGFPIDIPRLSLLLVKARTFSAICRFLPVRYGRTVVKIK